MDRKASFKKASDSKAGFERRFQEATALRKNVRQDRAAKKRILTDMSVAEPKNAAASTEESQKQEQEYVHRTVQQLPQLVAGLSAMDVMVQLQSVQEIRKLLSIEHHPPVEAIIASGALPSLIRMLSTAGSQEILFEAAWAITNIASGTTEQTHAVAQNHACPVLINLLATSESTDIQEQVVWALGNVAGDSPSLRDYLYSIDFLEPLLSEIMNPRHQNELSFLRNAVWTLSNMCRGKPVPQVHVVQPALGVLSRLVFHQDQEILMDVCWAFSYLSEGKEGHVQAILDQQVTRRFIDLLYHHKPTIQTPMLRTIGNIVTGNEQETQTVINAGGLTALCALLSHTRKGVRKETCWTLSNICAGTKPQIQAVIEANVIPGLIQQLAAGEMDVRREACWAIGNITTGGSEDQVHYLVSQGAIKPICDALKTNDNKLIVVALECLMHILRVGQRAAERMGGENQYALLMEAAGGVDTIEELEQSNVPEISDVVTKMIDEFFEQNDEDEEMHSGVPHAVDGHFEFGASGGSSAGQQPYNFK